MAIYYILGIHIENYWEVSNKVKKFLRRRKEIIKFKILLRLMR